MINFQTASFYRSNNQNINVSFRNAQQIKQIVKAAQSSPNMGKVLREIIELGDMYGEHPSEVKDALREIRNFHTNPANPLICCSSSVLCQIEKTMKKIGIEL